MLMIMFILKVKLIPRHDDTSDTHHLVIVFFFVVFFFFIFIIISIVSIVARRNISTITMTMMTMNSWRMMVLMRVKGVMRWIE